MLAFIGPFAPPRYVQLDGIGSAASVGRSQVRDQSTKLDTLPASGSCWSTVKSDPVRQS